MTDASASNRAVRVVLPVIVAVGLGLAVWTAVSITSGGWVPSVTEITQEMREQLATPETYEQIWITGRRILLVYVPVLLLGTAIGTMMGLNAHIRAFLRPLVVTGLAIPDVVYFILAALILGTDESAALVAMGIAVIPYVINIIAAGAQARDTGLDEMSKAYRIQRSRYLRDVVGLQMTPSILAASRTGFAFTWKLVVLMEAVSQPNGVGSQIYLSFRLLRPDEMISLAVIFAVLIILLDVLVFVPLERRLLAWMRQPARSKVEATTVA